MSRYVKCLFLFKDYALKKGNKNHTCPYFEGHIEEQRRCVKTLPPWFSSHMNIIRKPSEIFNSKLDAKTRQNWGLLRILQFWGIFRCNNPELGCGWSVWFKSKGHFFDVCLGSHHIQNALWRSKEVSDRIAMYLWLPIRCYSQDKSSFKIYSPAYNIFVIVSLKFIMHDDMSWYIPTQLLLIYAKSYRFYFEKISSSDVSEDKFALHCKDITRHWKYKCSPRASLLSPSPSNRFKWILPRQEQLTELSYLCWADTPVLLILIQNSISIWKADSLLLYICQKHSTLA